MRLQRNIALVCNITFAVCLVAVHFLERGPDPLAVSVSYYALTPHGWLAVTGFLALAAGSAMVSGIAWRSGDGPKSWALAASSFAMVVVAAFPADPWYPWEKWPTTSGAIHSLAACVPIVVLPLLALRDLRTHWERHVKVPDVGFAALHAIVSGVVGTYIISQLIMGRMPSVAGLGERAVVITGLLWVTSQAVALSA